MYEVNELLSTSIYDHLGMGAIIAREKNIDLNAMTPEAKNTWETDTMIEARDCMMAVHFLMGADQEVCKSQVQNLKNLYLMNNKMSTLNPSPQHIPSSKDGPGGRRVLTVTSHLAWYFWSMARKLALKGYFSKWKDILDPPARDAITRITLPANAL